MPDILQDLLTSATRGDATAKMAAEEISGMRTRMLAILRNCAEVTRPCKACGKFLYFLKGSSGKLSPYEETGLNHFATCPKAADFKRREG